MLRPLICTVVIKRRRAESAGRVVRAKLFLREGLFK